MWISNCFSYCPSKAAPYLVSVPCSCAPQLSYYRFTHSLCTPSCPPLTPHLFLPELLKAMGSRHLVASGQGLSLSLTWTVCQTICGKETSSVRYTISRVCVLGEGYSWYHKIHESVSSVGPLSFSPCPPPFIQAQGFKEEKSRGKDLFLELRNFQLFWIPPTQNKWMNPLVAWWRRERSSMWFCDNWLFSWCFCVRYFHGHRLRHEKGEVEALTDSLSFQVSVHLAP